MTDFFAGIPTITYDPDATHDFAYRSYNPDEVVMGKTMAEHLRFAVAYWHSFAWEGGDPFGGQTFERPWFGDTMDHAKIKADTAFDMFKILGQPYFCFHDADVRPEGDTFAQSTARLTCSPMPPRPSKNALTSRTSWVAKTMCCGAGAKAMKRC